MGVDYYYCGDCDDCFHSDYFRCCSKCENSILNEKKLMLCVNCAEDDDETLAYEDEDDYDQYLCVNCIKDFNFKNEDNLKEYGGLLQNILKRKNRLNSKDYLMEKYQDKLTEAEEDVEYYQKQLKILEQMTITEETIDEDLK